MSTEVSAPKSKKAFFFSNLELVIAILLGLVSIATAYASYQSSLYDSQMAGSYATGNNLSTEAESMYLEGNQQFVQDTQLWDKLTELTIDINGTDPVVAATAQEKYDTLVFQSVSPDFQTAIDDANAKNEADPTTYTSPLDNEDYQDSLFSGYDKTKLKSEAAADKGDIYNGLSDKLTLYTVLMSISLFLLGVAALVRELRTQVVLLGTSVVIFVVSAILTALVPYAG